MRVVLKIKSERNRMPPLCPGADSCSVCCPSHPAATINYYRQYGPPTLSWCRLLLGLLPPTSLFAKHRCRIKMSLFELIHPLSLRALRAARNSAANSTCIATWTDAQGLRPRLLRWTPKFPAHPVAASSATNINWHATYACAPERRKHRRRRGRQRA